MTADSFQCLASTSSGMIVSGVGEVVLLHIYTREKLKGTVFQDGDPSNQLLEILWIKFEVNGRECYYGVAYHPHNPMNLEQVLLDSIQKTLDRIWNVCDDPFVLLGGDFNQLPDSELQALGLCT